MFQQLSGLNLFAGRLLRGQVKSLYIKILLERDTMDGKTNNHKSGLGLKSALSLGAGVSAMLVGFASGAAWAQDADEEEGTLRQNAIVITALKRETTLQDTPVAVSVIGADDIAASSIRDIRDLQLLAPSLSIGQAATSSQQVIAIRGLGTGGFNFGLEPSVGIFVDGVYRSRPGAILGDFPTVERIEVLRGPQSTLYGRNTSAGVVSIITKKPSFEPGFEVEATLGNYGTRILKGSQRLRRSVRAQLSASLVTSTAVMVSSKTLRLAKTSMTVIAGRFAVSSSMRHQTVISLYA